MKEYVSFLWSAKANKVRNNLFSMYKTRFSFTIDFYVRHVKWWFIERNSPFCLQRCNWWFILGRATSSGNSGSGGSIKEESGILRRSSGSSTLRGRGSSNWWFIVRPLGTAQHVVHCGRHLFSWTRRDMSTLGGKFEFSKNGF